MDKVLRDSSKFNISIDLIEAARLQIEFLRKVDSFPLLTDKSSKVVQSAVLRYEHLWLPLVANNSAEVLTAPIDIAWVWHCHILSPLSYTKDCMQLYGKILDHCLQPKNKANAALQKAAKLWEQCYPDEPFDIDLNSDSIQCKFDIKKSSKLSYNLLEAVGRQSEFYYQVSLPHFLDSSFLQKCILRYQQYVYLKKQNPSVFLVPCYDIDLVWHTHQLFPLAYRDNTTAYLGRVLIHDDTVADRSPGSKLNLAYEETKELWRSQMGENYAVSGAMYRGGNPTGKLNKMSSEETFNIYSNKRSKLSIGKVAINGFIPSQNSKLKLEVCYRKDDKIIPPRILKIKSNDCVWDTSKLVTCKFNMDTRHHSGLQFLVTEVTRPRFSPFKKSKPIATASCDFSSTSLGSYKSKGGGCFTFKENLTTASSLEANVSFGPLVLNPLTLRIVSGTFTTANMPTSVEQLWGPVHFPFQTDGTENMCEVASHRLVSSTNQILFTARIIHSVKCMMSAIHIFYQDKMVAVGHLVGSDQLPHSSQVIGGNVLTFDPNRGERAVLIKNAEGDWGIAIGRWTGFEIGRNKAGKFGHLEITFWKRKNEVWRKETKKYAESSTFSLQDTVTNLTKGTIEVLNGSDQISENLCLVFSVSMLQVLCVPRPAKWKPGQDVSGKKSRKSMSVISSEDMPFVMATGLLVCAPTNQYIHETNGHTSSGGYTTGGCEFENDVVCEFGGDGPDGGGDASGGCGGCGGCGSGGGDGGGGGCGGGGAGCGGGGGCGDGGGCGGGCGGG